MKQYIETCLRNMTGFHGQFSRELEDFWRDVERQYKACNVAGLMIPQDHIPLWWARAKDMGIALEASSSTMKVSAPSNYPPIPRRPSKEAMAAGG